MKRYIKTISQQVYYKGKPTKGLFDVYDIKGKEVKIDTYSNSGREWMRVRVGNEVFAGCYNHEAYQIMLKNQETLVLYRGKRQMLCCVPTVYKQMILEKRIEKELKKNAFSMANF